MPGLIPESTPVKAFINATKKWVLPGFDGICVYEVSRFFFRSFQEDGITEKAGSISYSFFMAIFPGMIFMFTLIPYFPIDNFEIQLFRMLHEFLPEKAYEKAIVVLSDILNRPRGGLMSVGFLFTLYFATNGISSMINAFNKMNFTKETRSFISLRIISLWLFFVLTIMIVIAIGLIVGSHFLVNFLEKQVFLNHSVAIVSVRITEFLILIALCFFSISFLYYYAPKRKGRYRFISAGGTFATIALILSSQLFNFYINNFSKYNVLYGSIGTLIIFMIWLNFNAMILLIGYELNASIQSAKSHKCKELQ
ncbi:MAG: hypothetical protein A2275_10780 [Bacteroidetes bacterium RIFOXYA12_FULL_35_11]|nr:MAG: hypothetical protein A2X01_01760 [Bacteroidetes bacterium GWF2_35_48]OFY75223.1 MAG: hypothetical protein A2275_10780 [Bacteroidetes bacterium RIFOXYA12_FULL_35_11]OFY93115.1 MAG: hypothetical protein A2491_04440 [Bacteroidetes bacterium RIFOXYC12_FULL_35_7]